MNFAEKKEREDNDSFVVFGNIGYCNLGFVSWIERLEQRKELWR
jgi:hypothetical protein